MCFKKPERRKEAKCILIAYVILTVTFTISGFIYLILYGLELLSGTADTGKCISIGPSKSTIYTLVYRTAFKSIKKYVFILL